MRRRSLSVTLFVAAMLICGLVACARSEPVAAPVINPAEAPLIPLPPRSPLDETLIIDIGDARTGIGTAFAITTVGDWITARHVVDGCTNVSLEIAPGMRVPVRAITLSAEADLAHLKSENIDAALTLDLSPALFQGEDGFFAGYPHGRAGDVAARLANHATLITQGRRDARFPVLSWIEQSRSKGATGTLSGISGAPVFDESGFVRGVVSAESSARSRLYTTPPDALANFVTAQSLTLSEGHVAPFTAETYGTRASDLRHASQIVPVHCEVSP